MSKAFNSGTLSLANYTLSFSQFNYNTHFGVYMIVILLGSIYFYKSATFNLDVNIDCNYF